MTPEEADAMQEWKGMDGGIAFMLINRHADIDNDLIQMMHAWLRANLPVIEAQIEAQIVDERANNYSRILTILGMEDGCNLVATVEMMQMTLREIVNSDWRSWKELASPDEFVEWAKRRANHALRYCKNN